MREKVEEVLRRLNRSLGGGEVRLEGIKDGVVTVRYLKPFINPCACHRGVCGDLELARETVEEALREALPGLKEVRFLEG